jgi:uncharacterized membrane protein
LLDEGIAKQIRDFETRRRTESSLRWPVIAAWSLGGLMLLAGVLLFVSAHWDVYSPGERFAVVLAGVVLFHVLGVTVSGSQPILARVFHAVGTVSCGAGIFLVGQIFHLDEHWPAGFMLWSAGALAGWILLKDWVQGALAAMLIPIWLVIEWTELTRQVVGGHIVAAAGVALLAVTYFTAPRAAEVRPFHLALSWMGGLALIPSIIIYGNTTNRIFFRTLPDTYPAISTALLLAGWLAAIGGPLAIAFLIRRREAWINIVSAAWIVLAAQTSFASPFLYVMCGLASLGLMCWGVREDRRERINFGVATFGLTVLFFYFSSVLDKLNRSLGLIGFGILFIALGFGLAWLRSKLMDQVEGRLS